MGWITLEFFQFLEGIRTVYNKVNSDFYTGCADLGQLMIKFMNSNEDLKKAVKAKLGDDTKQITIANTAMNISDFRVDAMKTHQKMMKTINLYTEQDIKNANGKVIGIKKTPIVTYETADIAKVALLCDIEMDMNFGKINLEDSKYSDPDKTKNIVEDYEGSQVLKAFQYEPNRAELMQNPKKMQDLFKAATDELGGALDIMNVERQMGLNKDDIYNDMYNYNEDVLGDKNIDLQKIFG